MSKSTKIFLNLHKCERPEIIDMSSNFCLYFCNKLIVSFVSLERNKLIILDVTLHSFISVHARSDSKRVVAVHLDHVDATLSRKLDPLEK